MRIIIILLIVLAVALYAKALLPPDYFSSMNTSNQTQQVDNLPQNTNLREVPVDQLEIIKQVFSPELNDQ